MGNGNRYDGAIGIRVDEAGGMFGSLKTAVTRLQDAAIKTTGNPLSEPEIDFAVPATFRRDTKRKGGIFVTLTFKGPASMAVLRVHMIRTADRVDQPTFKQQRFSDDITDIDEDEQTVLGAGGNFSREIAVRLEYGTQYDVYRLEAFNSTDTENANSIRNPTGQIVYNTPPYYQFTTPDAFGAPSAPNAGLIVYNELDPITPDIYDAHTGLKIYAPLTDGGAAQTWADSLTDWVQPTLTRDFGGSTGVVRIPFKRLLTSTELTQVDAASTPANRGYVVVEANNLVPGGTYIWVENLIHSNGQKKTATGSVSFIAAALATDLTALTNTAIVIKSTDPFDGKHVQPFWEFTQTNPATALKNYTFKYKKSTDTDFNVAVVRNNDFQADAYHKQLNAGTLSLTSGSKNVVGVGTEFLTRLQEGWKIKVGAQTLTIGTITDDTHMTVTANSAANASGQAYTVVIVLPLMDEFKVKPSTTYNVQLIVRARSGSPLTMNATFTTDADGNVAVDSDVPTLATNPDTGTTGPTVHERLSVIKVTCLPAATNGNTADDYEVVLSTSSSAPAGDPTVGSESVLAVDHGQKAVFDIGLTVALTTAFYFYYRIHNSSGVAHAPASTGWSAWSVGTNQSGYSHPVEASIGPSVPTWSMALERSNTGGSAGNTTQKYYLDSGASGVTDAYTGSGLGGTSLYWAIYINDAGVAAADRVRLVIFSGQDGGGKYVLTNTVFSSAPGNALPYELHRGLCAAGKSGNGHGTTTFILDRNADAYVSTTSHDYDGMSLYLPTVTAGQQVQKITNSSYNSGTGLMTLTIEPAAGFSALGGAPANGTPYMICAGGFGYSASDATGTISPVPFRTWRDSSDASSVQIVAEVVLPTGENAFDLSVFQIQVIKKTAAVLRYNDKTAVATTTSYRYGAFTASVGTIRVRIRNGNRETAAKGWSDWSVYGLGYASADSPTAYTPATYVPVDVDIFDKPYYPTSRYPLSL
jgi:hypothetical protein